MRRIIINGMIALGLAAITARAAHAQVYAYVGDYEGNQVLRFDGITGTAVAPVPYISLSESEGLGGVNDITYNGQFYTNLLAVATGSQAINTYDISNPVGAPNLIGSIGTPGYYPLKLAFSSNGSDLYSGGQSGSNIDAGELRAYNFGTGAQIGAVDATVGIWGVAVDPLNGDPYWTTGWTGKTGGGVYTANPNLTGVTQVEAPGANGATGLVGIAFKSDGSFYVVNGGNGDPNNDFILHYAANGTLIDQVSTAGMPAGSLYNAFDAEIGPGGNLFVTSQNGACAVEFSTVTDSYESIFVPPHSNGLQQAKTIYFSTDAVTANTPEPGFYALLASLGLTAAGLRRRRRA